MLQSTEMLCLYCDLVLDNLKLRYNYKNKIQRWKKNNGLIYRYEFS